MTESPTACSSSPCQNGATCVVVAATGGYTCTCQSGYTGPTCAFQINECNSSPCQNGGTCTDNINGYTCQCIVGFTGPRCNLVVSAFQSAPAQGQLDLNGDLPGLMAVRALAAGSPPVLLTPLTAQLFVARSERVSSVEIRLQNRPDGANEVLGCKSIPGLQASYDVAAGVVRLQASASMATSGVDAATVSSVVRTLSYFNTAENPTLASRSILFTVTLVSSPQSPLLTSAMLIVVASEDEVAEAEASAVATAASDAVQGELNNVRCSLPTSVNGAVLDSSGIHPLRFGEIATYTCFSASQSASTSVSFQVPCLSSGQLGFFDQTCSP